MPKIRALQLPPSQVRAARHYVLISGVALAGLICEPATPRDTRYIEGSSTNCRRMASGKSSEIGPRAEAGGLNPQDSRRGAIGVFLSPPHPPPSKPRPPWPCYIYKLYSGLLLTFDLASPASLRCLWGFGWGRTLLVAGGLRWSWMREPHLGFPCR